MLFNGLGSALHLVVLIKLNRIMFKMQNIKHVYIILLYIFFYLGLQINNLYFLYFYTDYQAKELKLYRIIR